MTAIYLCSCGCPEYERHQRTNGQAHTITSGEGHRILVHYTSMRQHPDACDPCEQQGTSQPDEFLMAVELGCASVIDIEGQHHHRHVARCGSERRDHLQVICEVAATTSLVPFALSANLEQFGVALDQRKAQEDEQRERKQPEAQ